jgi:uncharacterized membrane protein (UPF0127 family)
MNGSLLNPRFLWLIFLAYQTVLPAVAAEPLRFETSHLTVVTAAGRHDFTVELALTPKQRARGLMFRQGLAADAGMLFDFGSPEKVAMWMKNTLIPLDMIFIRPGGIIANIASGTVPLSLSPVPSNGPVQGVLEVRAGTAARLDIRPGDRVLHPIFGK